MGTLLTICVIIAVLGLILVILSIIPVTSAHIPGGVGAGIALIVVGILLYIVLSLLVHPAAVSMVYPASLL